MQVDLEGARKDLVDPRKGFAVFREFWGRAEVEHYRQECERFMQSGTTIFERINTDSTPDYIHPRSHDDQRRTYRIYQFFHNHRSPLTDDLLTRSLALRNRIEEPWTADPIYRAERARLQDYVIVTKYVENTGTLSRHRDYQGQLPFPLIQFLVLLSQPGYDYRNGEFVLYTRAGGAVRVQDDLGMRQGDALLFDKSLDHEVENTLGADQSRLGRWSVLIGARAKRDGWLSAKRKALLYRASVYGVAVRVKRQFGVFRGAGGGSPY